MLTINKLMPQGAGLAPVLLKRASTIELDWDTRQKSRFDATDSLGRALGIFLARGTVVRGGDVLVAEDGSLVRVIAAPQPVLRITHCAQHGTPFDLVRAAYHLGNRHVPMELKPDHLKIEPDHVLADLLDAMHLIVHAESSAFEPEGGAYTAHGTSHGQGDAHKHKQEQDHKHEHEHEHDHKHDHEHSHDHGHSHDGPSTHQPAGPARAHPDAHDHAHDQDHGHAHSHDHGHKQDHQHAHDHDHDHPNTHDHEHGHGKHDGHKH